MSATPISNTVERCDEPTTKQYRPKIADEEGEYKHRQQPDEAQVVVDDWFIDNFILVPGKPGKAHVMDKENPDVRRIEVNNDNIRALDNKPETARAITVIAQQRGWKGVQVKGTPEFRRAVWEAATRAGLSVEGYTPTEQDKVAMNRYFNAKANSANIAAHLKNAANTEIEGTPYDTKENKASLSAAIDKKVTAEIENGDLTVKGKEITRQRRKERGVEMNLG